MSSIQLTFSMRVSSSVKTVHLLGSWDNYVGQLPLSKDKQATKSGSWKGTFRFQGDTLEAGKRYWYYYVIDGYHTSHNPGEKSTVEPTTGRELNVLDVPKSRSGKSSSSSSGSSRSSHSSSSSSKSSSHNSHTSGSSKSSSHSSHTSGSSKSSTKSSSHGSSKSHKPSHLTLDTSVGGSDKAQHRHSRDGVKGRPLSMSQIKCPKPQSPFATQHILAGDYGLDELSQQLAGTALQDKDAGEDNGQAYVDEDGYYAEEYGYAADGILYEDGTYLPSESPASSLDSSDLSYSSDDNSSQGAYSLVSGYSTPNSDYSSCTCERYGITRKGDRVRIDCGGERCGYEDSCSSSDSDSEVGSPAHRNGVVISS